MTQPPLEIVLEFARAKGAAEPFGYPLSDQEYFLTPRRGRIRQRTLPLERSGAPGPARV